MNQHPPSSGGDNPAYREIEHADEYRSLLDQVLDSKVRRDAAPKNRDDPKESSLEQFVREGSTAKALALWLNGSIQNLEKDDLVAKLTCDVARIDSLLSEQVNAVLHHPTFQKLEASWCGLDYLVHQIPPDRNIKLKVLQVSWRELRDDLDGAIEFDRSQLFMKVYDQEFGHPGGEPFGVLLGDYDIRLRPSKEHPYDDLRILRQVADVSAAAFAPFIANAHPNLLGLDDYSELEKPINLDTIFGQKPLYLKWDQLRKEGDTRFLGLTMPNVLMRLPYADNPHRVDTFRFRENAQNPERAEYLWGPAVYAFGGVLIRTFAETGWFVDIRGASPGISRGGVVNNMVTDSFPTEPVKVTPKGGTDISITDTMEKQLADLGFIPLVHSQDTGLAAFHSNPSLHRPEKFDDADANANARLSAMLQYMLCVSRFAHYLKVLARDLVGLPHATDAGDIEKLLNRWVRNYVIERDDVNWETMAKYPLREARVKIDPLQSRPGHLRCIMYLRPHTQLDQLVANIRLNTVLSPTRESS